MEIEEFIESFDGNQREVIQIIHNLMIEIPGIDPKIRFKVPFYYRKTWVCYMNPIKGNAVELCFVRAKELDYSKKYLTFGKRVQVGGIMMTKPDKIDLPLIGLIVEEALALDESTPYTFKKKR
ncbi:MAG: hypothetical protein CVV22_07660 [Ignavibacteriae bacterium HGW-Ignavibacteriae-1]|jgi:hypothetical protein|nr:MAG: hypothetical protein CVV22_07660 [Ignavibacteriae bacterium HGW-Ignavibacteriae-1]